MKLLLVKTHPDLVLLMYILGSLYVLRVCVYR